VQWVNRPNLDFRGFSGLITSGTVKPGDRVRTLPSGRTSDVTRISTFDGDLPEAVAGQSVTLVLADEIDISRGDVICTEDDPAAVADQYEKAMADGPRNERNAKIALIGSAVAAAVSATFFILDARLGGQPAVAVTPAGRGIVATGGWQWQF